MPWLELELSSSAGHSSDHLCSEMLALSFLLSFYSLARNFDAARIFCTSPLNLPAGSADTFLAGGNGGSHEASDDYRIRGCCSSRRRNHHAVVELAFDPPFSCWIGWHDVVARSLRRRCRKQSTDRGVWGSVAGLFDRDEALSERPPRLGGLDHAGSDCDHSAGAATVDNGVRTGMCRNSAQTIAAIRPSKASP